MKRILCAVMVLFLSVMVFPVNCRAAEVDGERVIARFDDGSYMTESVQIFGMRASGTITGTKTRTYYDNNGSVDWKAVLTGTFTYTGSSASCTASRVNVTIYDSSWYVVSEDAQKSGNKATASATMGQKALGVTVNKVPVSLTLSCDANGNLS